jgi:hypothetical protein
LVFVNLQLAVAIWAIQVDADRGPAAVMSAQMSLTLEALTALWTKEEFVLIQVYSVKKAACHYPCSSTFERAQLT